MDVITSLSQYISKVGIKDFAERFGIKERTAASWRYGERLPRHCQARELVKKSGGDLTMAMIYDPTVNPENSQKPQSDIRVECCSGDPRHGERRRPEMRAPHDRREDDAS